MKSIQSKALKSPLHIDVNLTYHIFFDCFKMLSISSSHCTKVSQSGGHASQNVAVHDHAPQHHNEREKLL